MAAWNTPHDDVPASVAAAPAGESGAARGPGPGAVPPPDAGTSGSAAPGHTQLQFHGIYLLTTGPEGPTAVPGLSLEMSLEGMSVLKDDGSRVWSVRWAEIDHVAVPERSKLPDGGLGIVVVVETRAGRAHRFVVPATNPDALETALLSLSHQMGVAAAPTRDTAHPVVVTAVVVATAVVVLVLLLAAGHVIHL